MLSRLFLGVSLVGAEWVLYLLVALSILSIAIILERYRFFSRATRGLEPFRSQVRVAVSHGKWSEAGSLAQARSERGDLETEMIATLSRSTASSSEALNEFAQDAVLRAKLDWDRNLAILATIGSNAPFIGLFGTVLGIIRAFHDLSQQSSAGAQAVSSGISEALVATAVGLLVAIPAVVAYNLFQRRVKAAMTEAEAMKSYLIGKRIAG